MDPNQAVHLELVSDLTTEAFIACLRRFVARRGKLTNIWSDHGTNFIGAARQLNELYTFLKEKKTTEVISRFCSDQSITWDFIPEHAPHFGGLWEAAVKNFKRHLCRIIGDTKLTFEEMTTTLTQIEACLNSRPLTPLPTSEDANFEVLTPGHFLIGRPLEAIPDCQDVSLQVNPLKRWHLCQTLIRHFWNRWSTEYFTGKTNDQNPKPRRYLLPSGFCQIREASFFKYPKLLPPLTREEASNCLTSFIKSVAQAIMDLHSELEVAHVSFLAVLIDLDRNRGKISHPRHLHRS